MSLDNEFAKDIKGPLDHISQRIAGESEKKATVAAVIGKFPIKNAESFIPGRNDYSESARARRIEYIEKKTGVELAFTNLLRQPADQYKGNIENLIGTVEIPLGIAGPIKICGDHANGEYFAPLATTEGALVASVNRGARALQLAGGTRTKVIYKRMSRAPAFTFESVKEAAAFADWCELNRSRIDHACSQGSKRAKLVELRSHIVGRTVHLNFAYTTAEAAGQNMVTFCTDLGCDWIKSQFPIDSGIAISRFVIEGNVSSDKKPSYQSYINGRGVRVIAEAMLTDEVLQRTLKVDKHTLYAAYTVLMSGATNIGIMGGNVNFANVISAMFIALGQDVACSVEASLGFLSMELLDSGVYCSVTLPSLIVGGVGGGTRLPTQREALSIIGCNGEDGSTSRMAEVIASYCLALDLSTLSALAAGHFAAAHKRLGRVAAVDFNKVDLEFFQQAAQEADLSVEIAGAQKQDDIRIGSSIISTLTSESTGKQLGFFCYDLTLKSTTETKSGLALIKVKGTDDDAIGAVGNVLAALEPEYRYLFEQAKVSTGFKNSQKKELQIYKDNCGDFPDLLPRLYGAQNDDRSGRYALIQELIDDAVLINSVDQPALWTEEHIQVAVADIAGFHAKWYGYEHKHTRMRMLGEECTAKQALKMWPLAENIVRRLPTFIPDWLCSDEQELLMATISSMPVMWQAIDKLEKCVIHNDFNPRNLAFRLRPDLKLVAYDWELAMVHIPQRDIAELLAFVLPADRIDSTELRRWSDLHWQEIQAIKPITASANEWWVGLCLAIEEFASNRFLLYCATHAVSQYSFMTRVKDSTLKMLSVVQSTNRLSIGL